MSYEIRRADREHLGPLLFEAPTEAELAALVLDRWPAYVSWPYMRGKTRVLAIWKKKPDVARGDPYAIAWKADGAPDWSRELWRT